MRALVVGLLALTTFGALTALTGGQVSSQPVATRALRQALATLTEADKMLAHKRPELLAQAEQAGATRLSIPSYPLAVTVTAEEVRTKPPEELLNVVLERSAEQVYQRGRTALQHPEGIPGGPSLHSSQGLIEATLTYLTASWHRQHRIALIIMVILAALFGGLLLLGGEPHSGLLLTGLGVGIGALFFLGVTAGLSWLLGSMQHAADDRVLQVFLSINRSTLNAALRNGSIMGLLGLTLFVLGLVMSVIEVRSQTDLAA